MLPYELTHVKTTRNLSIMATRKIELGDTGRTVARQIRRIRERNGLSLQELSDRLTRLGRPILPSGLSKIERGDRRVDVDDLDMLAAALGTIPNDLLLDPLPAPEGVSQEDYERFMDAAGMVLRASLREKMTHDPNYIRSLIEMDARSEDTNE
jgi:transcriptional regulator with XRE-family HTH domain